MKRIQHPLFLLIISANLAACGSGFRAKVFHFKNSVKRLPEFTFQSPKGNLLKNPAFEDGLAHWEDWGASKLMPSPIDRGSQMLTIEGEGGRGQEVIYRVKTGATYRLIGKGRVSDTGEVAFLGVRFFDFTNRTITEVKRPIQSTKWTTVSMDFAIPTKASSAKIFMWKPDDNLEWADFDELSLELIAPPTEPPKLPTIANPKNVWPSGPPGAWNLVFEDDFELSALNSVVWNRGLWFQSTLGSELQAYRPENILISNGILNLKAERRPTQTTWGAPMDYASGAITTKGKFSFTFGAIEARVRVPRGQGLWPSFWLLPEGKRTPPALDIMEVRGQTPSSVRLNYQFLNIDGVHTEVPKVFNGPDFSADFHTFTAEWDANGVIFYVDGLERHRVPTDLILRDPAFLILNLAIGGGWAGPPDATTAFPGTFEIDYVRIWQRP